MRHAAPARTCRHPRRRSSHGPGRLRRRLWRAAALRHDIRRLVRRRPGAGAGGRARVRALRPRQRSAQLPRPGDRQTASSRAPAPARRTSRRPCDGLQGRRAAASVAARPSGRAAVGPRTLALLRSTRSACARTASRSGPTRKRDGIVPVRRHRAGDRAIGQRVWHRGPLPQRLLRAHLRSRQAQIADLTSASRTGGRHDGPPRAAGVAAAAVGALVVGRRPAAAPRAAAPAAATATDGTGDPRRRRPNGVQVTGTLGFAGTRQVAQPAAAGRPHRGRAAPAHGRAGRASVQRSPAVRPAALRRRPPPTATSAAGMTDGPDVRAAGAESRRASGRPAPRDRPSTTTSPPPRAPRSAAGRRPAAARLRSAPAPAARAGRLPARRGCGSSARAASAGASVGPGTPVLSAHLHRPGRHRAGRRRPAASGAGGRPVQGHAPRARAARSTGRVTRVGRRRRGQRRSRRRRGGGAGDRSGDHRGHAAAPRAGLDQAPVQVAITDARARATSCWSRSPRCWPARRRLPGARRRPAADASSTSSPACSTSTPGRSRSPARA